METVGAYDAKTNLPKLLDRVAKGERIIITRYGSPVAILKPADPNIQIDVSTVIENLRRFRKKHHLNGLSIKDMVQQGRK